ncbi:MAG: regulatory iron-sulfur-containing complex subunit RicT [candidate division WOR-3 bacterium]
MNNSKPERNQENEPTQTITSFNYLYEVRIHPFRTESVILKSEPPPCYKINDYVVVQTNREQNIGQIIKISQIENIASASHAQIIRIATQDDFNRKKNLQNQIRSAHEFFENLFKRFKINAKIVFVDIDLNHYKTYCYIVSEKKIDYLSLHETAADSLKTRIAIKQIGVRDYARCLGGIGICGRQLCCRAFLKNIPSITLSVVREQNIFIEPEKISGLCGKLRCCLLYEVNKNERP